jgi:hypothetical protein
LQDHILRKEETLNEEGNCNDYFYFISGNDFLRGCRLQQERRAETRGDSSPGSGYPRSSPGSSGYPRSSSGNKVILYHAQKGWDIVPAFFYLNF